MLKTEVCAEALVQWGYSEGSQACDGTPEEQEQGSITGDGEERHSMVLLHLLSPLPTFLFCHFHFLSFYLSHR